MKMSSYVPSCERVRDFLSVLSENSDLKNRIEPLFTKARLSPDEVRVIGLAYGINGEIHLIRSISRITNTSINQVAEIEKKAVKKLCRVSDIGNFILNSDRSLAREIIKIVADFYETRVCEKDRKAEAVKVRYVAAYILYDDFKLSLKVIMAELGRHHATLLRGCKEIRQWINDTRPSTQAEQLRREIRVIRERIENRGLF